MIQLKLKPHTFASQVTHQATSPQAPAPVPKPSQAPPPAHPPPNLQPYINKVIDNLRQTEVKKELILPLEEEIRRKTTRDTEKLSIDLDTDAYRKMYLANARHIISNLKSNNEISNKDLISKINQDQITPAQLVNMDPHEMFPERWQPLIDKKRSDNDKLTKDPVATTTLYWCSRCGRNKCHYFSRQDRCSDEPRTIHITCCYCSKKWRM